MMLLAWGVVRLGTLTDSEVRTVSECLQLAPACDGERVALGYLKVRRVQPGGIEVGYGGQALLLVGITEATRPGIDEVSVEATWRAGGTLEVDRWILHRHRRWKRVAGLVALAAWLGWLGWLGRPRG